MQVICKGGKGTDDEPIQVVPGLNPRMDGKIEIRSLKNSEGFLNILCVCA